MCGVVDENQRADLARIEGVDLSAGSVVCISHAGRYWRSEEVNDAMGT